MKKRLAFMVVLVVCLGFLFTWAVSAQGPTPTPSVTPPKGGASQQLSPPPTPIWKSNGEHYQRPLVAPSRVSRMPARPSAFTLGQPGLSFRYQQTFGATGAPYIEDHAYLNFPYGVATEGADIWIADSFGREALKFSNTGVLLKKIGSTGAAQSVDAFGWTYFIGWIADIGVGSGGVWIVDTDRHFVLKFRYDSGVGNYVLDSWLGVDDEGGVDNSHFNYPSGIAFDSSGNIYVSDGAPRWDNSGNHRIQIFNSSRVYVNTIGVTGVAGSDNNHFSGPHHIAMDSSNRLYVADTGNHRVQIFDVSNPLAPTYIGTIGVSGISGSDSAHLNNPLGVAVDANYIYVADSGNHRIQIFSRTTWGYVNTLGSGPGTGDYQFNTPSDVAVDSAGNIYVADNVNARVQQFNSARIYQRRYGTTGKPYRTDNAHYNLPRGIDIATDGSIYITEQYGHRLLKLDQNGNFVWSVPQLNPDGTGAGIVGSDNTHFNTPQDVDVDATGRVYVADTWNHRIQIYNSNGTYNATFGSWGGCPSPGAYNFDAPEGLTIAPNGYLYVADSKHHRVLIYDSNRNYVATLGVTCQSGSDNAHFNWPVDVAVDSSGMIYVADSNNHRVQVFNSSRVYVRTIGVTANANWDLGYLNQPQHLAVDAYNRLYVADSRNDRIQVFDQTGAYLTTVGGSFGQRNGQKRNPFGIAIGGGTSLFVADWENHRVQQFVPNLPPWVQSNINGFGSVQNYAVTSLATFGGELFAGTINSSGNGAQVWRKSSSGSWIPFVTNGFGDSNNDGANSMVEFGGRLYVATSNWNYYSWTSYGGQVWRYNGSIWERVATGGFGDSTNAEILRLTTFNNQIYATTFSYSSAHGAEIWRSSTGDNGSWIKVVSSCFNNDTNCDRISALESFNGYLYAGKFTWVNNGAEIWRSNTGDSGSWSPVATNGFNGSGNTAIVSFAMFNGYLYAGTRNWTTGGQIWRCSSCDSNGSWTQVIGNGFGKVENGRIEALIVFDNMLYAVTYNSWIGTEVWRTRDGTNWQQVGFAGFGDSNNYASSYDNSVAVFNNRLYVGIWINAYSNGPGIWEYTSPYVYLPLTLKNYSSSATWVTITNQDFEGGFPSPWIVYDSNGATDGQYYWAKRNCRPYAGSYSGWAVGGGANGSGLVCGNNYPNGSNNSPLFSWMVYGPFSLADATAGDLKFQLWHNLESCCDSVGVYASINGSNFYGNAWTGNSSGWVPKTFDLTNVYTLGNLMGQPSVWVAFVFVSDYSVNYPEGAYIDNVVLRKCVGPGVCPPGASPELGKSGSVVTFPMELIFCQGNVPCPQPKLPMQPKK